MLQNEIFANTKKKEQDVTIKNEIATDIVNSLEKDKAIPYGYIPISIDCTEGKLACPKLLHFRNFTLEEVMELASYRDGTLFFKVLIKILTNINYESFNCGKLHLEELKEIFIKLYVNFIDTYLKNQEYLIDLEKGWKDSNNVAMIDIDLTKLDVQKLNDEFKQEPINIKIKRLDKVVSFNLPKIENIIIANEYADKLMQAEKDVYNNVKNKYNKQSSIKLDLKKANEKLIENLNYYEKEANEDLKNGYNIKVMSIKEQIIRFNEELKLYEVTNEEEETYKDYENKRNIYYMGIYQKLLIDKIDGKVLNLEEKLNSQVDIMFYVKYNSYISKLNFGVKGNYSFYCKYNKKSIVRRFPFRINDFLPSLEFKDDSLDDIYFD